jgi:pimeloyl-ACP methyl ester carboxylesterase
MMYSLCNSAIAWLLLLCRFVRNTKHTLPDGMRLELLHLPALAGSAADGSSPRPPLLFVHGSYHGAWCWRERWMPFFAAAGYDCYAVSLRGQGGSDRRTPAGEPLKVSGDLDSLSIDLGHVVASLPAPPVLVAHSFGALLAEKYLTLLGGAAWPGLAGVARVCGVPPSGNKAIVGRVVKRSLVEAWKITW